MRNPRSFLVRGGLLALLALFALTACAQGATNDSREPGGMGASGSASPQGSGAGATGGAAGTVAGSGAFENPAGPPDPQLFPDAGPMGCNDLQVSFEPVIPTVLLLVDRSGSMWDSGYGASPTRWQAIYDALMDESTGAVQAFASEVRFGLMTYTSDGGTHTCPVLENVPPALDNFAAIDAVYTAASERPSFKAETPTGEGVRAATELLGQVSEPGAKHIVLITDGEPDSCTTFDPQCGQDESIAAVQEAFAQDIATFVIGISSDVGAAHLQDVANAGAGLPVRAPDMQFMYNCVNPGYASMTASYAAAGETPGAAPVYQPADGDAIATTLRTLIRGVRSCSFTLEGEVVLEDAHLGTVVLDDAPLAHDDPDGWHMRDPRTLELVGAACTRLQTDATELLVSFPCDVIDVL
jgi:hypothetical protein